MREEGNSSEGRGEYKSKFTTSATVCVGLLLIFINLMF